LQFSRDYEGSWYEHTQTFRAAGRQSMAWRHTAPLHRCPPHGHHVQERPCRFRWLPIDWSMN